METLFSIVLYVLYGFFGLLLLLFVLAVLFGKRIQKRWEYEAEFRTPGGREFGEFEIELSRIAKEETEYSFKAKFRMQHESLAKGQMVQVFLDETLVLQGNVRSAGRIYLRDKAVVKDVFEPSDGQICRVVWGGIEQFRAALRPD
jgi:hypothetical protein